MRSVFALTLTLLGLAGCATTAASPATEDSVLADARSRSAPYCAKYKDGCEVTTSLTDDGRWTASVVPVFWATDGERVYGIDLDDFYVYDKRGRFVNALRGY